MRVLIIALLLAGCGAGTQERPEPEIRTVEVKVPVVVPCKALEDLGQEPAYPDTDEALKKAPDLYERTKLIVQGRLLRVARLAQYTAARTSC